MAFIFGLPDPQVEAKATSSTTWETVTKRLADISTDKSDAAESERQYLLSVLDRMETPT